MPTAKIHVHEHRYDEQRLARLGDAIQAALEAVLKVPPGGLLPPLQRSAGRSLRAHAILPRPALQRGLHSPRTGHSSPGRRRRPRLALLKELNERVVAATGISPDDLCVLLYELPGENISFGQGLAQRAHISAGTDRASGARGHLRWDKARRGRCPSIPSKAEPLKSTCFPRRESPGLILRYLILILAQMGLTPPTRR